MLAGLGYEERPALLVSEYFFKLGDEIIFNPHPTAHHYPGLDSYGIVTGCAMEKGGKSVYVVAPGSYSPYQTLDNYALLLLSESMIVMPRFDAGERFPLTGFTASDHCLKIDSCRILLDEDESPSYRYYLSLRSKDRDGMDEAHVQILEDPKEFHPDNREM